jgi:hypothetical protein
LRPYNITLFAIILYLSHSFNPPLLAYKKKQKFIVSIAQRNKNFLKRYPQELKMLKRLMLQVCKDQKGNTHTNEGCLGACHRVIIIVDSSEEKNSMCALSSIPSVSLSLPSLLFVVLSLDEKMFFDKNQRN